jgi:RNA polymerase sigma factor (TIGR02999 family)
MSDVTQILSAIEQGDPHAAEQLLPLVYDELRKLAAQKLAQERPGQTLQATALVHEAYIRLVDVDQIQHWDCRGHFFAAAAEAMRRILIDQARRKRSEKRGGTMRRVELDACALLAPPQNHAADDLRALDEALRQLEAEDPIKVALTMAGLILLIVVTLAGSIGWFAGDRAARWAAVERQVDLALQEATQLMEQARWPEARAWLERADGLLAGGGSRDEVRQRVSALRNDLDLVQRLEEVRMEKAAVLDGDMTYAEVDSRYAQAFGDYGIDLDEPGADGVAERIRQSAVCTELAAMIDDWAMVRRRGRGSGDASW